MCCSLPTGLRSTCCSPCHPEQRRRTSTVSCRMEQRCMLHVACSSSAACLHAGSCPLQWIIQSNSSHIVKPTNTTRLLPSIGVPPTYSLRPPAPFVRWPEPVRPCGLRDRVRPAVGLHRHAAPVLTAQRAGGEGDALQPSETAGGRATAHDRMRALWHTRPHTHTRAPRNTHADPHAHVRTYTQRHQCSATARACANGALSMGWR